MCTAVALAMTSGCGSAVSNSGDRITPRDTPTSTPTPAPAGMEHFWLHGVGIDAPSSWKPNQTECGTPIENTVLVEYAGATSATCGYAGPPRHVSVIEMSPGNNNMTYRTYDWQPETINGNPVEVVNRRTDDGDRERLVRFAVRQVTVDITSPDQSVIDAATRSLQTIDVDPDTGCVVHTNAYDDGKPAPQGDGRYVLPGHPTSATGCVYVSGWLEQSDRVTGDKLTTLVNAIQAAPATTDERAPDDANCESVANMVTPDENPPMVLHFNYSDSSTWTVVAKISWCTRWQSSISSGDVTRRIDQALLLALPDLWMMTPDPDSMDP